MAIMGACGRLLDSKRTGFRAGVRHHSLWRRALIRLVNAYGINIRVDNDSLWYIKYKILKNIIRNEN